MRVTVDRDLCEANAVCMALAPDVFVLDDDDEIHVVQAHPGEERRADVEQAVHSCPKQAITLDG
jgi:ferredoxin